METIHLFKIAEDSKKLDWVELIKDNVQNIYIVRYKWATMQQEVIKTFPDYTRAVGYYRERKHFAILCN